MNDFMLKIWILLWIPEFLFPTEKMDFTKEEVDGIEKKKVFLLVKAFFNSFF